MPDQFLNNFRKNFREKKLFRWLIVNYPKSIVAFGGLAIGYYAFILYGVTRNNQKENFAKFDAVHANDNVNRRNNQFLIYGDRNESKK